MTIRMHALFVPKPYLSTENQLLTDRPCGAHPCTDVLHALSSQPSPRRHDAHAKFPHHAGEFEPTAYVDSALMGYFFHYFTLLVSVVRAAPCLAPYACIRNSTAQTAVGLLRAPPCVICRCFRLLSMACRSCTLWHICSLIVAGGVWRPFWKPRNQTCSLRPYALRQGAHAVRGMFRVLSRRSPRSRAAPAQRAHRNHLRHVRAGAGEAAAALAARARQAAPRDAAPDAGPLPAAADALPKVGAGHRAGRGRRLVQRGVERQAARHQGPRLLHRGVALDHRAAALDRLRRGALRRARRHALRREPHHQGHRARHRLQGRRRRRQRRDAPPKPGAPPLAPRWAALASRCTAPCLSLR
eukprot:1758662-Pleurochrysis_carterae.AAC.1